LAGIAFTIAAFDAESHAPLGMRINERLGLLQQLTVLIAMSRTIAIHLDQEGYKSFDRSISRQPTVKAKGKGPGSSVL
jgi:hypothetical protein